MCSQPIGGLWSALRDEAQDFTPVLFHDVALRHSSHDLHQARVGRWRSDRDQPALPEEIPSKSCTATLGHSRSPSAKARQSQTSIKIARQFSVKIKQSFRAERGR